MITEELINRATAGEQRSIARLLTEVESSMQTAASVEAMVNKYPPAGKVVGFFGPPGVGKSTLVAALVPRLRQRGDRVAVVANDPTSAFGGGALLGDRVRMLSLSRDPGVFIRSAAVRDPLRSLSTTMVSSVEVLRRIGFGWVLVEAVGSGQSDLGMRLVADSGVLVLVPGLGDYVQAMKSGVMEVADIIVVNKADLPQSASTVTMLRQAVASLGRPDGLVPSVLAVTAADGRGVDALVDAIDADQGRVRRMTRSSIGDRVTDRTIQAVATAIRARLPAASAFQEQVDAIGAGDQSTAKAALKLAAWLLGDEPRI